jgi:hypothetical protein
MQRSTTEDTEVPAGAAAFYRRALEVLRNARVPFLVSGAFAFTHYTGIERYTKDFDVFVKRQDCERALRALAADGCRTELTFPHWLGKAFCGQDFIDIIFSSGNGVAPVDDEWFEHAQHGEVFGLTVPLCPAEEMIWQKSLIMERERYDGADVLHLLLACARTLDWRRLLARFGPHWRVLLSYLVLFGFVYPSERHRLPPGVMQDLLRRLQREESGPAPADRVCYGTILSRQQYLIDIERWGYRDARLAPLGGMSEDEIVHWTAAIPREH